MTEVPEKLKEELIPHISRYAEILYMRTRGVFNKEELESMLWAYTVPRAYKTYKPGPVPFYKYLWYGVRELGSFKGSGKFTTTGKELTSNTPQKVLWEVLMRRMLADYLPHADWTPDHLPDVASKHIFAARPIALSPEQAPNILYAENIEVWLAVRQVCDFLDNSVSGDTKLVWTAAKMVYGLDGGDGCSWAESDRQLKLPYRNWAVTRWSAPRRDFRNNRIPAFGLAEYVKARIQEKLDDYKRPDVPREIF